MTKSSGKYYYENILANQNVTAKTNIAWVADITTLELFLGKKIQVFLCIDVHTNFIVASAINQKIITTSIIKRSLKKAINEKFKVPPLKKLIIHTDRGTQFSSSAYHNFTKSYEEYFIPSMGRENTPTDNPVAERFMRTFKEHKIHDMTIEESISNDIATIPGFSSYRAHFNKYIKSLNSTPNRKSKSGSQNHYNAVTTAAMLMLDPNYPKAHTEHIGEDLRLPIVENYKSENKKVVGILAELAARKAELVDKTPFDDLSFENSLAFQFIDKKLEEIYSIIQNNPETTKEFVVQAIEPVEDSLEELHRKVDLLLPKRKQDVETLPLRDPIDMNLFPIFFANAGSWAIRRKDLKQAQLRVAYTLLYHTGLRVNEIREFTHEQIINSIKSSQVSVIHHKTKQAHIHVLSQSGVMKLRELKLECEIIFNKYDFKYLFGKKKPMHKLSVIRLINKDLRTTSELNQIPFNIKSHSFRINMISSLLKNTSVQNAAQIIGHTNVKSTMSYQRYALSKDEIQKLLDKID